MNSNDRVLCDCLERRNFWKAHPDRDSMVTVLLQHIDDTSKLSGKSESGNTSTNTTGNNVAAGGGFVPTPPPGSMRPSNMKKMKIPNYCGLKYFVREVGY
jgi:hypothetical protein